MGAQPRNLFVATCATTGKRAYSSRDKAKRAGKETGPGLSAFRCLSCGLWHIGHRGNRDRQTHRDVARRGTQ